MKKPTILFKKILIKKKKKKKNLKWAIWSTQRKGIVNLKRNWYFKKCWHKPLPFLQLLAFPFKIY